MKIAKALGAWPAEFFAADEVVKNAKPVDKILEREMAQIESLGKKDKAAVYTVIDTFVTKKKLRVT